MKSFTEYAIFVMQAHLAGREIWFTYKKYEPSYCYKPTWNWEDCFYYIKLPEGWEYVIEDGEIAFREPKQGEYYMMNDCSIKKAYVNCLGYLYVSHMGFRPIIKRKGEQ